MDRFSYRIVDQAQVLIQAFPQGLNTDTVVISIYDIDDNAADVSSAAMTNESGNLWSYAWTPSQTNNYQIDYYDSTMDVHYYEYVKVTGSLIGVAGGSGTGSTQANLRTRFLKLIDNYNANDLTGTNSSGEVADLCINDALQLIYAQLKDSKFMQAYPSTSLVSVVDQAYIELSGISDLDEVAAIKDTTNDITLKKILPYEYFGQVPDPSAHTGTPVRYCRLFNRIYLDPRPTAVVTYTTEYIKSYARLASDSDVALIPSKYDDWIYKEARVLWYMNEDIQSVPQVAITERDDARELYINDAMSNFDLVSQSKPHFGGGRLIR